MGRFRRHVGVSGSADIHAERLAQYVMWRGRPFEPGDWRLYDEHGHTTGYELDGSFQRDTEPLDAMARFDVGPAPERPSPPQDGAVVRVCSIQPRMSASVPENASAAAGWIREAAETGADLVVFPEMMLTGYDAHLHDLFGQDDWYASVEAGLEHLAGVVETSGTPALVGSPWRQEDGFLNALVLLRPGQAPTLAGARTFFVEGWKVLWGFIEAEDRSPVDVGGIAFGSVFCAEASFLDHVVGRGIEASDLVLWPGVATCKTDENGQITRDGCAECAKAIADRFGVPVIQSSYAAQVTNLPDGRILGGMVACDAQGAVVARAPYSEESMLSFDVTWLHGTIQMMPDTA